MRSDNVVASRLKSLRSERGLTQRELADSLGISTSAITMYENGRRIPKYDILETIADYFNVDMNYLYGVSDVRNASLLSYIDSKRQEILSNLTTLDLTDVERVLDYTIYLMSNKKYKD